MLDLPKSGVSLHNRTIASRKDEKDIGRDWALSGNIGNVVEVTSNGRYSNRQDIHGSALSF